MPVSDIDANHKEIIRKQSPNLLIMPIEKDRSEETQEGGITEEENDSHTRDISLLKPKSHQK